MTRFLSLVLPAFLIAIITFLEERSSVTLEYDPTQYRGNATIEAPPLLGFPLKIFASFIRLPVIGVSFGSFSKNDNKFENVRSFANSLKEIQEYYDPFWFPKEEEVHRASKSEEEQMLSSWEKEIKPIRLTSADYVNAYLKGNETPTSAIKKVLSAIKEYNKILHFISEVVEADALKQAEESTRRYASNTILGPLDGVPIMIKEELMVKGYNQTIGTSYYHLTVGGEAKYDEPPVLRLRKAGAIIIGTTVMHELGVGVTGNNPNRGTARNPYNPQHYTGGSSSGSGSVVAAGLVPIAIGTDSGGSIRIPSGLCGIYGLKATFQRVGYKVPSTVHHVGPLTSNVRDLAITYKILGKGLEEGEEPAFYRKNQERKHVSLFQPPAHLTDINMQHLNGIRIGIMKQYVEDCSEEVLVGFNKAISYLVSKGAIVVELKPIPKMDVSVSQTHAAAVLMEMTDFNEKYWREYSHLLNPETVLNFGIGRSFSSRDYLATSRIRSWLGKYFQSEIFNKVDVLITPMTAMTAPKIPNLTSALKYGDANLQVLSNLIRYAPIANLLGLPAGTAPVEFTKLPISIQTIANHWNEHLILRVMRVLEIMPKKNPLPQVLWQGL